MKVLGILLVIVGIIKFSIMGKVDKKELSERLSDVPVNVDTVYDLINGFLLFEGLLEVVCGLFIVFL